MPSDACLYTTFGNQCGEKTVMNTNCCAGCILKSMVGTMVGKYWVSIVRGMNFAFDDDNGFIGMIDNIDDGHIREPNEIEMEWAKVFKFM